MSSASAPRQKCLDVFRFIRRVYKALFPMMKRADIDAIYTMFCFPIRCVIPITCTLHLWSVGNATHQCQCMWHVEISNKTMTFTNSTFLFIYFSRKLSISSDITGSHKIRLLMHFQYRDCLHSVIRLKSDNDRKVMNAVGGFDFRRDIWDDTNDQNDEIPVPFSSSLNFPPPPFLPAPSPPPPPRRHHIFTTTIAIVTSIISETICIYCVAR